MKNLPKLLQVAGLLFMAASIAVKINKMSTGGGEQQEMLKNILFISGSAIALTGTLLARRQRKENG